MDNENLIKAIHDHQINGFSKNGSARWERNTLVYLIVEISVRNICPSIVTNCDGAVKYFNLLKSLLR